MEQQKNWGGGVTLILREGDSLDNVPQSHLDIVTPEIREAFTNPSDFFRAIAWKSKVKNFSVWLNTLINTGSWSLQLADTYMMKRSTIGGFRWSAKGIYGAIISPGKLADLSDMHEEFSDPFAFIRCIHWGEIAHAGGLFSGGIGFELGEDDDLVEGRESEFSLTNCVEFGCTECGDQFIFTPDGQAGFFSHEVRKAYRLGTIHESLNWIFGALLAGHEPQFDYSRVRSR